MQLFPNQQSYPNNTQYQPYVNTQFQPNANMYYQQTANTQYQPNNYPISYNPYQVQQVSHESRHHRRRFDSPEDLARFLLPFVYPPNYYNSYYQPYPYYQQYPISQPYPYYQQYPYNPYYPQPYSPYMYVSEDQSQSAQPVQGHYEDSPQDELV